MAERNCVHCGGLFEVNGRAGEKHRWCSRPECQRDRKVCAQRTRRARARGAKREPRSPAARRAHAAYMAAYRASDPRYRERERVARKALRARVRAVSEAGSNSSAAEIYVDEDVEVGTRLRVVTASGKVVTIFVDDRGGLRSEAPGPNGSEGGGGAGFSAVSEAG